MSDRVEYVSIRPGMNLLKVLPHLNYTHWHALGEFIDNALQSYFANRAALRSVEGKRFGLAVDIDIEAERGEIRIRDNASGISEVDFQRAFRLAEAPPDGSGLSEFGMGMKSAAAWLAPRWTIRSSALGEAVTRQVTFDIAQIVRDTTETLVVETTPARADEHFTEIVLHDVRKTPHWRTVGKIQEHLGSLYRRFLDRGHLRLTLNGVPVTYEPPEILTTSYWRDPASEPRLWRTDVKIALEDGRRAEGWVAIRARGSTTRAGLALFRRDRVIHGGAEDGYRPREVFGASNSFSYQRLFGEFDLIGFQVSHTKDGVRWDEAEEEFAHKLKAALSDVEFPLLDQAQNWRSGVSPIKPSGSAGEPPSTTAPSLSNGGARGGQPPRIQTRPLQIAKDAGRRTLRLDLEDGAWEVDLAFDYGEASSEWMEVAGGAAGGRKLQVKLSMRHPFSEKFLGNGEGNFEGVARLATGLAIAEAIAQQDGVRFSGRIRTSLNELLWMGLAE